MRRSRGVREHGATLRRTLLDHLSLFGLAAVTLMLVTYALEARSDWFILAFAGACCLGSAYGFMQGAWPFGGVEAVWSLVALRRWLHVRRTRRSTRAGPPPAFGGTATSTAGDQAQAWSKARGTAPQQRRETDL